MIENSSIKEVSNGTKGNTKRPLIPFHILLENEISAWKLFRETLKNEDQKILDELLNSVRIQAQSGAIASRPFLSEVVFLSIAIEQQKMIDRIQRVLIELTQQTRKKRD